MSKPGHFIARMGTTQENDMEATSTYDARRMQKASSVLGAQSTTLENPSCFGVLATAASEVSSLRARVESMVERLCGSVPTGESACNEGIPHPGMGLLPIADSRCRDVLGDVNAAHAALDRLEKSLP